MKGRQTNVLVEMAGNWPIHLSIALHANAGHQRRIYVQYRNADGTWGPWIEIGQRANATTGSSAQVNRGPK